MGTWKESIPALSDDFCGEREWYEGKTPQHPLELPTFHVSCYPVRAAQTVAFLDARGGRSAAGAPAAQAGPPP